MKDLFLKECKENGLKFFYSHLAVKCSITADNMFYAIVWHAFCTPTKDVNRLCFPPFFH